MHRRYASPMGRLRELLDELKARRAAVQRADDERARDEWRNEGGQPPPPEPESPAVRDPEGGAR